MPRAADSKSARSAVGQVPVAQAATAGCGCDGSFEEKMLEEIVAATYWFEAEARGKPYSMAVFFKGHRVGLAGKLQSHDRFEQVETVGGIVPGSGPVSVTARVHGVSAGEWIVTAEPLARNGRGQLDRPQSGASAGGLRGLKRTFWPWLRHPLSSGITSPVRTRLTPFVSVPASIPAAWWGLVAPGVVFGLALQAMLVARAHVDVRATLTVSLTALSFGFMGAKVWFLAVHRGNAGSTVFTEGLCIQGFIAGAAASAAALLALFHLPAGTFLDATAPGLLVGMAIGRPGCFLTGCCAGRPTASRWGVFASDRRVGMRRIPIQLWESLACLAIGLAALFLVLNYRPPITGAVFVGAIATYTLCRQFLLPLRSEPRKSSIGPRLTIVVAALVLVADIVLAATD